MQSCMNEYYWVLLTSYTHDVSDMWPLIGGGVDYDFQRLIYNVTFSTGATCAVFNIAIHDDMLSENDETFNIVIMERSLPYGIEVGNYHSAVVAILDNDSK